MPPIPVVLHQAYSPHLCVELAGFDNWRKGTLGKHQEGSKHKIWGQGVNRAVILGGMFGVKDNRVLNTFFLTAIDSGSFKENSSYF